MELTAALDSALAAAREGDETAFAELYRAYAGSVYAFLTTQTRTIHDAEDVLGETFLSAWRDIGRFDGGPSGFRAWLFRIATNRAIDLARHRSRRPEEPLEAVVDAADDEVDVARQIAESDMRERLWAAVGRLPAEQARVVGLRLAGGLTSKEIAGIVGKRVGAVKALQHRALANLVKALQPVPSGGDPTLEEASES